MSSAMIEKQDRPMEAQPRGAVALTPTTIVSAAIIAREDGHILISQRPSHSRMRGFWEFPGGKLELGEDPRAALRRECLEELGVQVEVGRIYETIFHRVGGSCILLLFYLVRIEKGEPRSMEQNALEWVTPEGMELYELLEADKPLVALFQERFPHFAR
jgi:8-oxo-dGTP diphosphatase